MITSTHRPCGACAAYVPLAGGCTHWRPGIKAGREAAKAREAARARGVAAKERAKRDVEEFQRAMRGRRRVVTG